MMMRKGGQASTGMDSAIIQCLTDLTIESQKVPPA
eukprot:CAMPEP_0172017358 /NCGR_PEP_ID=MMETSP1041-20130122/11521_1 /TAXON_ID=464988 /ORGANISM="Hemiselmis andersenii, Strain CCMP439" /LENGTH=34 /DNA_ID= /DNA_START= /DNA_END= /DNA_ORIENTATION=